MVRCTNKNRLDAVWPYRQYVAAWICTYFGTQSVPHSQSIWTSSANKTHWLGNAVFWRQDTQRELFARTFTPSQNVICLKCGLRTCRACPTLLNTFEWSPLLCKTWSALVSRKAHILSTLFKKYLSRSFVCHKWAHTIFSNIKKTLDGPTCELNFGNDLHSSTKWLHLIISFISFFNWSHWSTLIKLSSTKKPSFSNFKNMTYTIRIRFFSSIDSTICLSLSTIVLDSTWFRYEFEL